MANQYGAETSNRVEQARVSVTTGGWTALQVGTTPLNGRKRVRLQNRGLEGSTVALQYANGVLSTNPTTRQTDVTFTAPTGGAGNSFLMIGESDHWEPVGDKVTVYGRVVNKAGSNVNSVSVIVTEFA